MGTPRSMHAQRGGFYSRNEMGQGSHTCDSSFATNERRVTLAARLLIPEQGYAEVGLCLSSMTTVQLPSSQP
eukprot:6029728-Pleurochrysis_carterae.AAC.1